MRETHNLPLSLSSNRPLLATREPPFPPHSLINPLHSPLALLVLYISAHDPRAPEVADFSACLVASIRLVLLLLLPKSPALCDTVCCVASRCVFV